jgi:saccharopine dehydrogenase (NAD+, L-lysine forming)
MVSSSDEIPNDAIVLGIKELPDTGIPISHTHLYYADAYKKTIGKQKLLKIFKEGNGIL